MHEHRVIERTVQVLSAELESVESGAEANVVLLDQAVDFMRTYADRCHHGKEEDILFRRLADKGLERHLSTMMEGLIDDHVRARTLVGRLADATARYRCGDADARSVIVDSLKGIVRLYPAHIETEDKHFFKPAIDALSPEEREQMVADFDEFERSLLHNKYMAIVEEMESTVAERETVTMRE